MAEAMLLDQELSNAPATTVPDRQRQVAETWDYYELDIASTVAIGGAALAMYGMDARPDECYSEHPFDVDVITNWLVIKGLMHQTGYDTEHWDEVGDEAESFSHREERYPIDAFNNGFSYGFRPMTYVTLRDALDASEVLHGVGGPGDYRIAHPRASGLWKLAGLGRPKDIMSTLKGHVSAHLQGLPVAEDPGWQAVVERAADMAGTKIPESEKPAWLAQIQAQPGGFRSHKAFTFLDR